MKSNTLLLLALFGTVHLFGQVGKITMSGSIIDKATAQAIPFVNIIILTNDSAFVAGTISDDVGFFQFTTLNPGKYILQASFIGYTRYQEPLYIGSNSPFLDIGKVSLSSQVQNLDEAVVSGVQDAVGSKMDKKTYSLEDNRSTGGGSVMQSIQNLPGITVAEGQISLRGNNKVMVMIDGKQTAITGFGNQNGLDNIPASSIEKIEIINNPSSKYDANGNAGIINIIMKKEELEGVNGKASITAGIGSLWVRQANFPNIRDQYQYTPKINPSVSVNYRKKKVNFFLSADNLYTETLNKNEFTTRTYADGSVIRQQLKRNRDTNFFTAKTGVDWAMNSKNNLSVSGLFGKESIKDYGDQPFYNADLTEQLRLWQFLEDEVMTSVMATADYEHQFEQPGHKFNFSYNYTFEREDEKYFFDNTLPDYVGKDNFALIADQQVSDLAFNYIRPLKHGHFETGAKFRSRSIPTNMVFNPGLNSPLDTLADGKATYRENIPAAYGNYIYESPKFDAEVGLRVEYVALSYDIEAGHNTYTSDGYTYFQPFPNARFTYKLNDANRLSLFFNRRVDRPDEVDIRIFPKYDDAEIIKVGNPSLQPQFTNAAELGYKKIMTRGFLYLAAYHKISDGTITRIATSVPDSRLIYNISQNAGRSYNTGLEVVFDYKATEKLAFNLNLNGYRNQINAFSVLNLYPIETYFTAPRQVFNSGNAKLNTTFTFATDLKAQLSIIYLARDIIPQGSIAARYTANLGITKSIQKGKGELFLNGTDVFNTLINRKTIVGTSFSYSSSDYNETQVFRVGYSFRF